jgi:hypothetical protein
MSERFSLASSTGASMKNLMRLLGTVLIMTILSSLCWANDKREAKPRFKGVELYSWKDKGGDWVFALLDGTNRGKSEEEVKGSKDLIKSVPALKKALTRLAEGEQVSWSHRIAGFKFPPKATRDEIEAAAKEAKIVLRTTAERD